MHLITSSVQSIKGCTFLGCTSLEQFNLHSAKSIGYSAFEGCYSLVHVEIAYNVETIGSKAFYNCASLVEVTNFKKKINSNASICSEAISCCNVLRFVLG